MAPTPTSGTSTEKKERAMVRADAAVHPRLLSCTLRAIASTASHLTRCRSCTLPDVQREA